MSAQLLERLAQQSEQLTLDEQLILAMRLIDRVRQGTPVRPQPQARRWRDMQGVFKHPLAGEDAQAWVTRTRQEGDERRDVR